MIKPQEAEVAASLRSIGAQLHSRVMSDDACRAALEHLGAAATLLAGGERRLRWYEDADDPSTRARNRDLSPWSGLLNTVSPPITLEVGQLPDGRPAMLGHVRLDRVREGPPRHAHGGVVAGLFDEVMGAAQRLTGREGGVTGRLVVRYRKFTPLDTDLLFRAWIDDDRHRRVKVKAHCVIADDTSDGSEVTAEAEAVFLRVKR